MRFFSFFIFVILAGTSYATNVVLDFKEATNGYGTVSGHVEPKSNETYRVTLVNGGLPYSTITDIDGRWSIVFRLRSTQLQVTANSFLNNNWGIKISDSFDTLEK